MTAAEKLVERIDFSLACSWYNLHAEELLGDLRAYMLAAPSTAPTPPSEAVDIVFDGPPDHDAPRFLEVESPPGTSIRFGEWVHRDDGYWVLRFSRPSAEPIVRSDLGTIHSHDKCGVIEGWILQIASAVGLDTTHGITGSQVLDAIERGKATAQEGDSELLDWLMEQVLSYGGNVSTGERYQQFREAPRAQTGRGAIRAAMRAALEEKLCRR